VITVVRDQAAVEAAQDPLVTRLLRQAAAAAEGLGRVDSGHNAGDLRLWCLSRGRRCVGCPAVSAREAAAAMVMTAGIGIFL
jgi:hypothetical protein